MGIFVESSGVTICLPIFASSSALSFPKLVKLSLSECDFVHLRVIDWHCRDFSRSISALKMYIVVELLDGVDRMDKIADLQSETT